MKGRIVWKRVKGKHQQLTVTKAPAGGVALVAPRDNAGYYTTKESLKRVTGIDLNKIA